MVFGQKLKFYFKVAGETVIRKTIPSFQGKKRSKNIHSTAIFRIFAQIF